MLDKIYRKLVHGLIVKYLTRCGGAFHHGEYGKKVNTSYYSRIKNTADTNN